MTNYNTNGIWQVTRPLVRVAYFRSPMRAARALLGKAPITDFAARQVQIVTQGLQDGEVMRDQDRCAHKEGFCYVVSRQPGVELFKSLDAALESLGYSNRDVLSGVEPMFCGTAFVGLDCLGNKIEKIS